MIFKEDWEKSKERFDAYWQGEIVDRCCIAVTAPRNKPMDSKTELMEARDLFEKWTNSEYRFNQMIHYCSNTFFGGEAFPKEMLNMGPGVAASFVGSSYVLGEDTVWFDRNPIIQAWENKPEIKLNENSEMWKIVWEMTEYFSQRAEDKYVMGISDLGGTFDIAVSLRGNQELLYDLYDYPDEVKSLIEQIDEIWFSCYEKLYSLINRYVEGTTTCYPLWCRERWYPVQCDFSAMISPSQFEEFVLPSLIRQIEFLDKSIYHLDGPQEIPHLDYLLDIDRLTGIQWAGPSTQDKRGWYPDSGNEKWIPLFKKIQAKGKNLLIDDIRAEQVEKILENISPRGVFISTACDSEDDARELLKKVG